jgi:hypothetical protein
MPIQDAIKAIREAKCKITLVFESFQYAYASYSSIIVCSVYDRDVIDQQLIVDEVVASFVLNNASIMNALANAMMESCHPIILFFQALNLSEFDDELIAHLISKMYHPITLVFNNLEIKDCHMSAMIDAAIKAAQSPITLVFENSELSGCDTNRLAKTLKGARVPVTLYFIESSIRPCEPLIAVLKEALAPIYIKFDDVYGFDQWLYNDAVQDNFAIDARTNPSGFLRSLGFSMVSLMLNTTLYFCPKELIEVIKSYISDSDLAWTEMLAIRTVEAASYENKYASINTAALLLKYFPQHQVNGKKQAMDEEGKNSLFIDTNHEVIPREFLTRFLTLLYSKPQIASAVTVPDEFTWYETLIKFLTLVPMNFTPPMIIPAGFVNVPGDGLCFYHAIARQLGDVGGLDLRRGAVNEILVNYQRYQGFLEGNFWDDNLESAEKDTRGWAGHIMIQAVANILQRPIEIRRFDLDGTENQDQVLILPRELNHDYPALRLGNIANLHFVAPDDIQLTGDCGGKDHGSEH